MLTGGQIHWIDRVVSVFERDSFFRAIAPDELLDATTLGNLGDAIRIHHAFSDEPFTKDKFEYVLVRVLRFQGKDADKATGGNPGHDATVDDIRLSLKTQADKRIKENRLWISKFMELGTGDWGDDPSELRGLLDQFLEHTTRYERVFSLRALRRGPDWKYELVEIPLNLLKSAEHGELEMKMNSKQYPKPGYCHVRDALGKRLFQLYFDGGTERKLQVRNLEKSLCNVCAEWEFFIPD